MSSFVIGTHVNIPTGVIDLEKLRGNGLQSDEIELPEEATAPPGMLIGLPLAIPIKINVWDALAEKFVPDDMFLVQLESMGFGRNRCIRALKAVDNSSAEAAMTWLFEHGEDADIDDPLPDSSAAPASSDVDEAALANLMAMGFDEHRCRHALKTCDGNVERSVDWLFSHTDDIIPDETAADGAEGNGGAADKPGSRATMKYRISAAVTHLGQSTGFGHYVAHVFDEKEQQWIYYNDSKVSDSQKPPLDIAYLYFLKRVN